MSTFPLRMVALLVSLTPLAVAAGACTTEDGTTASCVPDVDQAGNARVDNGCNPFPACPGDPTAEACCVGADNKPLVGRSRDECLYGFGVVGSINVSSSSTSGAGGGGAGGGGGGAGGGGGGGGAGGM